MKRIYIISGEVSGEQYAAEIINALHEQNPALEIRAWGGESVKKTKARLARDISETAFMGFGEVIKNIGRIRSNFAFCKKDILDFNPDKILFIDYPGFNLRMAKWAFANGFHCEYFIAPKAWAWNKRRVHKLAKYIQHLYCIFPFEEAFFSDFGVNCSYVGNPTVNAVNNHIINLNFRSDNHLDDRPIIALLPGSRKQEIKRNLPVMLSIMDQYPNHQFCIGRTESMPVSWYDDIKNATFITSQTYDLVKNSEAALVCSGTATLEVALLNCPQVVCYKTSNFNYWIAERLSNLKYISLVNIISQSEVIKELIQDEFIPQNVIQVLNRLLGFDSKYSTCKNLEAIDYKSFAATLLL